jgi:hypothetical protein
VFGDQEPESDHRATDLIGEELSDAAFKAGRIARFGFGLLFGAMGFNRWLRVRTIAVEFFFAGQSLR